MSNTEHNFGTRWFEEVWNKRRREAIGEMIAPHALFHEGADTVVGPDGFYPFFDRLQATFSDMHVTVHDSTVLQDKVWVRWSCKMVHTGDGLGMPPTGRPVETTGMSLIHTVDGQAVEAWQNWDMLGLIQQIQGSEKSLTYVVA